MVIMRKIYDLFVSGGRDSVVAATVAYDEARQQGVECRVVYINVLKAFEVPEGLLPHNPLDYVRRFTEWLGADLVVIEPKFNYWEGVKRWGYPHLVHRRWCFQHLKKEPLIEFTEGEVREGYEPVHVLGIRWEESWLRARKFPSKWEVWKVGSVWVKQYFPILDWSSEKVRRYIKERGVPENPLWSVGFSCECLCMAGMSAKQLDRMISMYPDLFMWLAEKDREVQKYAKERETYVRPLCDLRIPLYKYVEEKLRQPTIEKFMSQSSRPTS